MRVALVVKPGHADSGVGRYSRELAAALRRLGHDVVVVHPTVPLPGWLMQAVRRWTGLDVEAFLHNYPVWARYPRADVYHLTSQNLATLMLFRRPPGQTVITVHDLIPWLVRHRPGERIYRHPVEALFDWLTVQGLRRPVTLLADSAFTRESLRAVGVAPGRVTVVPLASGQSGSGEERV